MEGLPDVDEGREFLFDFYYGKEADSFTFVRIPKLLFTDDIFKDLSNDARLLYGLFLDRMSLSRINGWTDDANRVYIVYTITEIAFDLRCSENKAGKVLSELDCKRGIGLIEKKRRGLGMADLIYVKNFSSKEAPDAPRKVDDDRCVQTEESRNAENTFPETQNLSFKKCKNEGSRNANLENCVSRNPKIAFQETQNLRPNNTKYNNTDSNYTDPSSSYPHLIRENIDLDGILTGASPLEKEISERLYGLMCDVVDKEDEHIRISGKMMPYEAVKSIFLKIGRRHFEYAVTRISRQYREIRDFRAYALTVLYRSMEISEDKLEIGKITHISSADGQDVLLTKSGNTWRNQGSGNNRGLDPRSYSGSARDSPWSYSGIKVGRQKMDYGRSADIDRQSVDADRYPADTCEQLVDTSLSWSRAAIERDWGTVQKLLLMEQIGGYCDRQSESDAVIDYPVKNEDGNTLAAAVM